jgi:hypothetical protein
LAIKPFAAPRVWKLVRGISTHLLGIELKAKQPKANGAKKLCAFSLMPSV